MRKRITILSANLNGNQLILNANESINGLQPAEQILVDSDCYSFIYLMEDQNDYTYIIIPEQLWPNLQTALMQKLSVLVNFRGEQMELTNFQQEVEYVLSNIKDNSNYGEEMVTKVNKIFFV